MKSPFQPPILVVGCGHSGTSLVMTMLDQHPEIHAIPRETGFLMGSRLDASTAVLGFRILSIVKGKRTWAEKTPKHVRRLRTIEKVLPSARIVCMVRDGRDVALSIRNRNGDFAGGCRRWVEDNQSWLPSRELPNFFVLRYEELVRSPEIELRRLCDFLQLRFVPEMLHPESRPRNWYSKSVEKPETAFGANHNSHRNWQINQPLFDGSGRWKTGLVPGELATFDEIAGDTMVQLGYYDSKCDNPHPAKSPGES